MSWDRRGIVVKMFEEGVSIMEIHRRTGFPENSVRRWCDPAYDARQREVSQAWRERNRERKRETDRAYRRRQRLDAPYYRFLADLRQADGLVEEEVFAD